MSENMDKVNDGSASSGEMGQRYLASGESVSMRLWDGQEPGDPKPEAAYFVDVDGARGAHIVVDMEEASQIPPWWNPSCSRWGQKSRTTP